jgi:primary-amine oxidase
MTIRRLRPVWCLVLLFLCLAPGRALVEPPPPGPNAGKLVEWEGWTFRWTIRPRQGVVLTDVTFQGRKVLKYLGLEEIFVPYDPGQPRPEDSLDGMGINLIELLPGKDCIPGTVCRMLNSEGQTEGRRVIGIHEESTGLLYVGDQGRAYGKMLVFWWASRLGDYDYVIRWRFRDDGMIMPDVGLTGRLNHTRTGAPTADGTVVGRNPDGQPVFAPSHVHNFYYRLDFDVDGPENDVLEEFEHRQASPGRSFHATDGWTPVTREGARSLNGLTFRKWRVADRVLKNALGHARSWEILPGGNGVFRGAESEAITQGDLWVTRFKPREFPLSSVDPRPYKQAMPTYLNGESVEGTDLVVWYSMHVHHIPRTEDWPAMPIEWVGFQMGPRDFLDASPVRPEKP